MKKLMVALALVVAHPVWAADGPIAAAIASPSRPASHLALDAGRMPAEMLALGGLKPGQTVLDVVPGGGYYTRLAALVAGPKGRVVALMPPPFMEDDAKAVTSWDALKAAHPTVELMLAMPGDAVLPQPIDLTIFHLTYHDLYWESVKYRIPRMDPAAFLAKLYAATRPGGAVLVVDHVAPSGAEPRAEAERSHRIDPAVVKADFLKAGFKLGDTSSVLANPLDDHRKLVYDPEIRGKTDRFAWKFVKPER